MAAILEKFGNIYHFLFEELPDERTKDWFLVSKPYQGLTVITLYLMFVCKWGPQWMKNRPPFNLDKILIVYNFLQVLFCAYIFEEALRLAWLWDYKWVCEPMNRSHDPKQIEIAGMVYYYFLTKLLDLMDTIFFVLRKKSSQTSFLHLYHHTGMFLLIWAGVTYFPGGHGTLVGVINCFVHVVMYSYYLYSVVVPSAKNSIWWKKYITQLQIVQFFLCAIHMGIIVFVPDCAYPRWISAFFLPQNLFMFVLFTDFYIKNYIKKPSDNVEKKKVQNIEKNTSRENEGYFVSRMERKMQ